jgi:hypothetical protein
MPEFKHSRLSMRFLACLLVLVGLPASVWAMSVSLAWDPSPSDNISGYKLYYKPEYSGPPYDGRGAHEGDSPIDIGDVTSYTISGLDGNQTYYFVVTAYNAEAESGPSNEVSTAGDSGGDSGGGGSGGGSGPDQGVSSTGGGGGGGGCFIDTAAAGCSKVLLAYLLLSVPLFVLSFWQVRRRVHR